MNRRTASSLRAAARGAVVESLELRRLLSYQPGVEILADTPQAGELFGSSIATNGNLALIGAPDWGTSEVPRIGRAFLVNLSDPNNPVIEHVFTNPEPEPGDQFGAAVAWVNGKIAISTPEAFQSNAGAVYVYDDKTDTAPMELANPTGSGFNSFGAAMTSIDSDLFVSVLDDGLGNSAVVQYSTLTGATIDTHTIPSTGTIALAAKDGFVLTTTTNNGAPAVAALDPLDSSLDFIATGAVPLFGFSIAATDNSVLIGSPFENLVYEYFDNTSTRTFAPPPDATPGVFGWSLAVSGSRLLVGDIEGGALGGGQAHVFDLTSGNPIATLESSTPANSADFGAVAAALPNGGFLVGDPFSNNFGAVYAFTPTVTEPTGPSITPGENGELLVVGTAEADTVNIFKDVDGNLVVTIGDQTFTGVGTNTTSSIVIELGDGDNVVSVSPSIQIPMEIYAGAGNDSISGGSGNDIIVGGGGNDIVYGGSGRDLIIGGDGADTLHGEVNDDVLISSASVFDGDSDMLKKILAEWTLTGSLTLITEADVEGDFFVDSLTGNNGVDWFFRDADDIITDLKQFEQTFDFVI